MGYLMTGLMAVVVGALLVDVGDTPVTADAWDVASLVLVIVGAAACLVGVVRVVRASPKG